MKKKGFTLIELLAVIIVLGVIALITTPIVMNSINDARRKSMENSALGIIRAIDVRRMRKDVAKRSIDYKINVGIDSTAIEYSGQLPDEGWAHIDEDGYITLYMKNENYCVYRDKSVAGNDDIVITDHPEDCNQKIGEIRDNTAYAEIRENTIIDGEESRPVVHKPSITVVPGATHKGIVYMDPTDLTVECTDSTSVSTTGTKTGCMKFYIYDDSGDTYKLILDHNITNAAYEASGTYKEYEQASIKSIVDTETTGWVGSPRIISGNEIASITNTSTFYGNYDSWFYLDGTGLYKQTQTSSSQGDSEYAWLFDYTAGCTSYGCNIADSSTYGYWTSSPVTDGSMRAWGMQFSGGFNTCDVGYGGAFGVRPVITLSKSEFSS